MPLPAPLRRVPASPSELSDVTARLLYGCIQVKPVGLASGRRKRGQSLRGTVEEPGSSNRISASRVGHGHTDLRKPLPQISFLNRPRFPPRLQHLVGGERTACLHERSSRFQCLLGRQGLLRHRLHPRSAVRQGPAQSVARPGLTSAAYGVPVTITPSHMASLSSRGTGCAKERPSAASRAERATRGLARTTRGRGEESNAPRPNSNPGATRWVAARRSGTERIVEGRGRRCRDGFESGRSKQRHVASRGVKSATTAANVAPSS